MSVLDRLEAVIAARLGADPARSYVARLAAGGPALAGRKVGEEAIEVLVAALGDDRAALTAEAADLVFHLMVLLAVRGVPLADVLAELDRREGLSGLDEKASRGPH